MLSKYNLIKRVVTLTLVLAFTVFSCFCIRLPDQFSSAMLAQNIEKEFITEDCPELESIVAQPLRYLGKGTQAIAFVSEDGLYVLKFFLVDKFHDKIRLRLPFRKILSPHIRWPVLERYDRAFREIKEETALLGIHITANTTHLPMCTLQGPQGKVHQLDLNKFAFLVQKRADCLNKTFSKMTKQEKESTLTAMEELVASLAKKGFYNIKHSFQDANYGMLNGQALMIDVGNLNFVEEQKLKPQQEVQRAISFLNQWSEKHR